MRTPLISISILLVSLQSLSVEVGLPPSSPHVEYTGEVLTFYPVFSERAENGHYRGEIVPDPEAHGENVLYCVTTKAYHPDTGVRWDTPPLESGRYKAVFRIRGRGKSDNGLVGEISVSTLETPTRQLVLRSVHDYHHLGSPDYFDVSAVFELGIRAPLRAEIRHNGQTDLWVEDFALLAVKSAGMEGPAKESDSARGKVSLNGYWDFLPVFGDLVYPPVGEWANRGIRIPSAWNANGFAVPAGIEDKYYPDYPDEWNKARAGWHRLRFFFSPEAMDEVLEDPAKIRLPLSNRRVILKFSAVLFSAEIYLNGKLMGYHEGGFTPFEVDVTNALRPGEENELLVGVRTWTHYMDDSKRRPLTTGSFWGEFAGGIWQDVSMESRPALFIEDIFVQPSVGNERLRVAVRVRNRTADTRACYVRPEIAPFNREPGSVPATLQVLNPKSVSIAPLKAGVIEWTLPAKGLSLWSPSDPALYVLEAFLWESPPDGETGLQDRLAQRFGYRDFSAKDGKFFLNGKQVRLRGDAWHFMGPPQMSPAYARAWYELARETGLNTVRLHAQPFPQFYLDLADEMGMLIVNESSWWASSGGHIYRDAFRTRFEKELREFIERDRNHPSVVIWSVANEVIAGHRFYSDDGIASDEELISLAGDMVSVIREMDPTRPIGSDGDGDLGGHCDLYGLHYPYADITYDAAGPINIGEAGPMYYAGPIEVDRIGGEDVYRDFGARNRAVGEQAYWQMRNYRRWADLLTPFNVVWYCLDPLPFGGGSIDRSTLPLGSDGLPDRTRPFFTTLNPGYEDGLPRWSPSETYSYIRKALSEQAFFPAERGFRFFTPGRPDVPFLLFNDASEPKVLTLRWSVTGLPEPVTGEVFKRVAACGWDRISLTFGLPEVTAVRDALLKVDLVVEGQEIASGEYPLVLYPDPVRVPGPEVLRQKRIAVFSASEDVIATLNRLRISYERILDLARLENLSCDLLLIGRSSTLPEGAAQVVYDRIMGGMRVLFMEGNASWLEGLHLCVPEPVAYDRAFPCRWDHPLFKGLHPRTFEFWKPVSGGEIDEVRGERLGNMALAPYQRGNVTPLLYVGAGRSAVLEGVLGRGFFLINQMDLLQRTKDEPATLDLMRNLVTYAATRSIEPPRPASLLSGKDSLLKPFLQSVGASLVTLEGISGDDFAGDTPLVIVDGSLRPEAEWWPRILRFVRAGGKAVVWGMTAETARDWTGELVGAPIVTGASSGQMIRGLSGPGLEYPLLDGLRHALLYRVKGRLSSPVLRNGLSVPPDAKAEILLDAGRFDWSVWEGAGEPVKTAQARMERNRTDTIPAIGLCEYTIGRGKVYYSQMVADPNRPELVESARQLLHGLGVRIESSPSLEKIAFNVDDEGFIRSWLLCGPYTLAGATESLLFHDFLGGENRVRPRPMDAAPGGRRWEPYFSPHPILNFEADDVFGWTDYALVYAATYIYSSQGYEDLLMVPDVERVDLLFGSDDGCAIWLNGDLIYREDISRPAVRDNVRLEGLRLRQGWNCLLFKVEDKVWDWAMVARLVDKSGRFPSGIFISPEPLGE